MKYAKHIVQNNFREQIGNFKKQIHTVQNKGHKTKESTQSKQHKKNAQNMLHKANGTKLIIHSKLQKKSS